MAVNKDLDRFDQDPFFSFSFITLEKTPELFVKIQDDECCLILIFL